MQVNISQFIQALQQQTYSKDIELEDGFNLFIIYKQNYVVKETLEFYKQSSRYIMKFLKLINIDSFNKINDHTIIDMIEYFKNKGNSNTTINHLLTTLKSTMNYLIKEDIISNNNVEIKKLKAIQPKIKYVNILDLKRILDYIQTLSDKSKLIVLLLIATGIRRKELTLIKLSNIEIENKRILLTNTKAAKNRFIFINDEIIELILKVSKNNSIYLFENNLKPISVNSVSCIIKKIKVKLNIENLSPHKLRHSYATILLKRGCNIFSVQHLLGHSQITTTEKYLHINDKELQSANNKYNPLNILENKKE